MITVCYGPSVAVLQTENLAAVKPKSEFMAECRFVQEAGNVFVLIITTLG